MLAMTRLIPLSGSIHAGSQVGGAEVVAMAPA
jgi:hypothetical protein